jgi:hypothetical protein
MSANTRQLFFLKCLLQNIASSLELKVIFQKSSLIPINIPDDEAQLLAGTLGCQIAVMPFTYLGLSMGTNQANNARLHASSNKDRKEANGRHSLHHICW